MITHHPSETSLLVYAAGTMPEALALVLATHLTHCATCRHVVADLEAIAGALLDEIPPASVALEPDALDQLLAREAGADRLPPVLNPDLRAPLNRVPLGRSWPIGVGVRWRSLQVPGAAWGGLIVAQPGRSLPRHRHKGLELTCLLSGAFIDGGQEYTVGDIAEPDADHDNPPVAIGDKPCVCVIATEGMQLRGLFGLAQRLMRK